MPLADIAEAFVVSHPQPTQQNPLFVSTAAATAADIPVYDSDQPGFVCRWPSWSIIKLGCIVDNRFSRNDEHRQQRSQQI